MTEMTKVNEIREMLVEWIDSLTMMQRGLVLTDIMFEVESQIKGEFPPCSAHDSLLKHLLLVQGHYITSKCVVPEGRVRDEL